MKIGMAKVKPGRMQTAELKPKEIDALLPQTPMRGIQAGQSDVTRAVLRSQATPAELAALDAAIAARLAKEVSVWLKCDSARCGSIGSFKAGTEGGNCLRCNWKGEKEGGHMRAMSAAAVKQHIEAAAAADAAALKRARAAGFAARNKERDAAGLPALTSAQYEAEASKAFKSRVDMERRMGESYAKGERERRAKEGAK
jgi:hypothetical protein